eukprot:gb/GECG01014020.1/.p1 GENE.gb/GECG01014020.1/~~gb/GECG01014020.1/.p1  ORF type:complete len:224 (+),score=48.69 gb/GECG01014020.1/:1-672(+)
MDEIKNHYSNIDGALLPIRWDSVDSSSKCRQVALDLIANHGRFWKQASSEARAKTFMLSDDVSHLKKILSDSDLDEEDHRRLVQLGVEAYLFHLRHVANGVLPLDEDPACVRTIKQFQNKVGTGSAIRGIDLDETSQKDEDDLNRPYTESEEEELKAYEEEDVLSDEGNDTNDTSEYVPTDDDGDDDSSVSTQRDLGNRLAKDLENLNVDSSDGFYTASDGNS